MNRMIKAVIAGVITLWSLLVFAQAVPGKWENFTADGKVFSCQIPSEWNQDVTNQDAVSKVYGITLYAPDAKRGQPVFIQVDYYPKDNLVNKTPQVFIKRHLDPLFKEEGETNSPISTVEVGGRICQYFEQIQFRYFPPETINPTQTKNVIKFIIVPETDDSYFVLRIESPVDVIDRYQPVFDTMVKSFKPQAISNSQPSHAAKE